MLYSHWLLVGWILKRLLWLTLLLVLVAVGGFAWYVLWPVQSIAPLESTDELVYLDQGPSVSAQTALQAALLFLRASAGSGWC